MSENQSVAIRGAGSIFQGFLEYHQRFRELTRDAQSRYESCDWEGLKRDTVKRLELHAEYVGHALSSVRRQLEERVRDREVWSLMKSAYTHTILGREDAEVAQTFFNSVTRRVFPHDGVDPTIDYVSKEFPLPYRGWEMASARTYGVRQVDSSVVRKILEDSRFGIGFRSLKEDARLLAGRIREAVDLGLGPGEIDGLDVLRPILVRNKAGYIVGRARRGLDFQPLVIAVLNGRGGLKVDALIDTQEEASIVFSFARWYFHADVESPRQIIGFLHSILPRKRIAELYISLGYNKHGKTELYTDLTSRHCRVGRDVRAWHPASRGLVMSVFTLPSYEFVFKVIKDTLSHGQKRTSRRERDS